MNSSLFSTVVLLVSLFCFAPLLAQASYSPAVGDSFFIDLASGDSISLTTPGTAATVYDVNLTSTSNTTIAALKALGIKVVCYVPVGVASSTDADYSSFPSGALGNLVSGSSTLRYLDINNTQIYPVIEARLAAAAAKGCDGVDMAYVDTYGNATSGTNTGFDLTLDESVLFFQNMATSARLKNLTVGLRNGRKMIRYVENLFADFAIVENCFYKATVNGSGSALCGKYTAFINDSKPVFPIEYYLKPRYWCRRSNKFRYFGGYYPVSLNGSYTWCSTVATLAKTPSPSPAAASASMSAAAAASASMASSIASSVSMAASIAASVSVSPSLAASVSMSPSLAASVSMSVSLAGSVSPSPSLAASVAASIAASPSTGVSVAASPSVATSSTKTCISCPNCGTGVQLNNKCTTNLNGVATFPNSTTFCCTADISGGFSYSWHVVAANCSVSPLNQRKLGLLCTALGGTATCTQGNKVGKVKLTCK